MFDYNFDLKTNLMLEGYLILVNLIVVNFIKN